MQQGWSELRVRVRVRVKVRVRVRGDQEDILRRYVQRELHNAISRGAHRRSPNNINEPRSHKGRRSKTQREHNTNKKGAKTTNKQRRANKEVWGQCGGGNAVEGERKITTRSLLETR